MDWIFFGPAKAVAASPFGVVGFAILMIGVQVTIFKRSDRNRAPEVSVFRQAGVLTGLLWLIFVGYELQMGAAISSATRAASPLRWDLLVLTPILIGMTAFAFVSIWKQWRR